MKYWLFKEYLGGGAALFFSREEAENFRRKLDKYFLDNPSIGEAMDESEYDIMEVELNPNFEKWINE